MHACRLVTVQIMANSKQQVVFNPVSQSSSQLSATLLPSLPDWLMKSCPSQSFLWHQVLGLSEHHNFPQLTPDPSQLLHQWRPRWPTQQLAAECFVFFAPSASGAQWLPALELLPIHVQPAVDSMLLEFNHQPSIKVKCLPQHENLPIKEVG